jgi:UDP-N-acetylglucosamine acyltransferase
MPVHSSAVISPKSDVAKSAEIGPFCVIGDEVVIGEGTKLLAHVYVEGPTVIGADNVFQPYSTIGVSPQDLKYHGERAETRIGDRNLIREFVTIHRGTESGGALTSIGDDNLLQAYAHVAHDCRVGSHTILAHGATLGGHVEVEDYAVVGAQSGVHQFCRIGAHAIVGGCTKIVQDVPPFMIADGHPASLRGLNLVGLQRRGFTPEAIRALKTTYKALFLKKEGNLTALILAFADNAATQATEVQHLLSFLSSTDRGIVR